MSVLSDRKNRPAGWRSVERGLCVGVTSLAPSCISRQAYHHATQSWDLPADSQEQTVGRSQQICPASPGLLGKLTTRNLHLSPSSQLCGASKDGDAIVSRGRCQLVSISMWTTQQTWRGTKRRLFRISQVFRAKRKEVIPPAPTGAPMLLFGPLKRWSPRTNHSIPPPHIYEFVGEMCDWLASTLVDILSCRTPTLSSLAASLAPCDARETQNTLPKLLCNF
jgi:hypothetical protein